MSEEVDEKTSEPANIVREIKIENLVSMVGNMNRFLALLAGARAFADAELGLAEWLVLGTVSGREGTMPKHLVRFLGLAPQRVGQLVERLKDKHLLSQTKQPANSLILTEDGNSTLLELNAGLLDVLRAGQNGRERAFFAVEKNLKHLIKMISPPGRAGER
ncbi:MAG: helix-turn-helix domain-containing protein [Rhizomicrobium sp.]